MSEKALLYSATVSISDDAFKAVVKKGLGDALQNYAISLVVENVEWNKKLQQWDIYITQEPDKPKKTDTKASPPNTQGST